MRCSFHIVSYRSSTIVILSSPSRIQCRITFIRIISQRILQLYFFHINISWYLITVLKAMVALSLNIINHLKHFLTYSQCFFQEFTRTQHIPTANTFTCKFQLTLLHNQFFQLLTTCTNIMFCISKSTFTNLIYQIYSFTFFI